MMFVNTETWSYTTCYGQIDIELFVLSPKYWIQYVKLIMFVWIIAGILTSVIALIVVRFFVKYGVGADE